MNRIFFITLILFYQIGSADVAVPLMEASTVDAIEPQEIGLEESPPSKPIDKSERQNWLFAAGTIIVGTIAALVVGWSQGHAPPADD